MSQALTAMPLRPTRRMLALALALLPVAVLPTLLGGALWPIWASALGGLVLVFAADALLALPVRRLRADVSAPSQLYIGEADETTVALEAAGGSADVHGVLDLDPEWLPTEGARTRLAASPVLRFPLRARRRGALSLDQLWLRWTGPLGLSERRAVLPLHRSVAVVPNLRAVHQAGIRFFSARDPWAGLRVERYVGDGSEFETLREYVRGMDHRAIDWKSSARHRKLLCAEFRAERNHQVVVALDTGHLMSEPLGGMPRLDHAISAALLLSYVSLHTGDRVGLFAFDQRVRAWSAPAGSLGAFSRLEAQSAELEYSSGETNFTLGLAELSTRLARRSLVVLFTDFTDTVTAELMVENVARIARKHLVLFVALRDPALAELSRAEPAALPDVYRAVVADDLLRERDLVLRRIARLGVHCIDALPEHAGPRLIDRYLEVKRRELV